MLVCRNWLRVLGGSIAIKAAEEVVQCRLKEEQEAASIAKANYNLPSPVRFFAMAITDDIGLLSKSYNNIQDPSTDIGRELQDYLQHDYAEIPNFVASTHPFAPLFQSSGKKQILG